VQQTEKFGVASQSCRAHYKADLTKPRAFQTTSMHNRRDIMYVTDGGFRRKQIFCSAVSSNEERLLCQVTGDGLGKHLRPCHDTHRRTPQLHNCEELEIFWVYFKSHTSLCFVH